MFNIFSYEDDKKELEDFYNERSHQDNNCQYCAFCGDDRKFIFDRCEVCNNN